MPATGVDWRRALRKLADGEEEGVFLVDVDRLKAQGLRAASADSAAAGKEEDIARTVLKAHDRTRAALGGASRGPTRPDARNRFCLLRMTLVSLSLLV